LHDGFRDGGFRSNGGFRDGGFRSNGFRRDEFTSS
jgi:hypothetical protein